MIQAHASRSSSQIRRYELLQIFFYLDLKNANSIDGAYE